MTAGQMALHEATHVITNPRILLMGLGSGAVVGLSARKLTHHWFETINQGEVGVWFSQGSPMLEKGFTLDHVAAAEAVEPFTEEWDKISKIRHYRIVENDQRFVPFKRTLQKVDVAHQTSLVQFPLESEDMPRQKILLGAAITWHVSPEGDHPVHSITRVKHHKTDKKDHDTDDSAHKEKEETRPLEATVQGISMAGLGRVLSGRKAYDLHRLTYTGNSAEEMEKFDRIRADLQQMTIEQTKKGLIRYGVVMNAVELLPIVRSEYEVQAGALRSLSPLQAAIAAAASEEDPTRDPPEYGTNVSRLHQPGLPSPRIAQQ